MLSVIWLNWHNMRKWISRILLVILLIIGSWVGYVYQCASQAKQYNVLIETIEPGFFGEKSYSIGSGVIISPDGWILTAKHVLEDALSVRITLSDGRVFNLKPDDYVIDPNNDVGLVNLSVETNQYVTFSDSNGLESGDIVYNIGNAGGIWDNSFFLGIVYKTHFKRLFLGENSEFIVARMYIADGCSGGGVYHYQDLIGVAVMSSDGAIFIISSNICEKFYDDTRNKIEIEETNQVD